MVCPLGSTTGIFSPEQIVDWTADLRSAAGAGASVDMDRGPA